jgi:hypothetical protein
MNRTIAASQPETAKQACVGPSVNGTSTVAPSNVVRSAELNMSGNAANDPMRRFTPTPHVASLRAMARCLRLETNSSRLLSHMLELFGSHSQRSDESADFLWRIIVESGSACGPPWPRRSTFSDEGMRFAQFGQRNFLAVDLDAREAVGFVSEGLFEDAHGFTSPFIDSLFYMTAGVLGLVPFAAACVRCGTNALLVLGPPNQGKTTSSYLAIRDGLTLHADQSVFLELVNDELRAWGDFVPVAFRPETLDHLPELRSRTHPFSYCDFNFHYMPRERASTEQTSYAIPTCCVVLERGASSSPRLEGLADPESLHCLSEHIAFKDDRRFEENQQKVLAALSRLPLYHLAYDSNPGTAASFFRTLLSKHGQPAALLRTGS